MRHKLANSKAINSYGIWIRQDHRNMLSIFIGIVVAQTAKGQAPKPAVTPLPPQYEVKAPAAAKTIATINGEAVKASDVEAYLWDWRGYEALQDVISFRVIEQAAKKANVQVSDAEAMAAMDKQLAQMEKSIPAGKTLDEALIEQGYPKSRIFMRVRSELLLDKIVLKDLRPAELVKVSTMIFRATSEQTKDLAEAIKRADAAAAELQKGTPWEKVLEENERDPRILKSAGNLGWKALAAFPASIAQELMKIKPGQYTQPAQTPNGIQIFMLESVGTKATAAELE